MCLVNATKPHYVGATRKGPVKRVSMHNTGSTRSTRGRSWVLICCIAFDEDTSWSKILKVERSAKQAHSTRDGYISRMRSLATSHGGRFMMA